MIACFASSVSVARLHGYSTGFMLVEHMEPAAFTELYGEYKARRGCMLSLREFEGIAGRLPGYLQELCHLDGGELRRWVAVEVDKLLHALDEASHSLGMAVADAAKRALRLLSGSPPRDPLDRRLGEALVRLNIAYPCLDRAPRTYLPQLPLYFKALRLYAEEGVTGVDRALSPPWGRPARCGDGAHRSQGG
jgi:hypothetical protein